MVDIFAPQENKQVGISPKLKTVRSSQFRKTPRAANRSSLIGATMRPAYFLPLLLAGLAWQPAHAAPLYKWVDSAGHVTYSSLPPPAGTQAEKVQAPPQPSAEEIRQAEEQVKKAEEQASELEAQRCKQEAKAAEEARLRAMPSPPAPAVIEQPIYLPQPTYYPPVMAPPRRRHDKPPRHRPRQVPERQP